MLYVARFAQNCDAESDVPQQNAHARTHKHTLSAHTALLRLPPRTKALPTH